MSSFLSNSELEKIPFKSIGTNVRLSRLASIYNPDQITIGSNVRIDDFTILSAGKSEITIGSYVHIAAFCGLVGEASITLEDFSGLSSRVFIYSSSDDYSGQWLTNPTVPAEFRGGVHGSVRLGRHVIIGTNSTILPSVVIGEGSAVGAHSLVNKSLPDFIIAAGCPVRILKKRKADFLRLEEQIRSGFGGTSSN
jgi:galactoside O-acetyltransferase